MTIVNHEYYVSLDVAELLKEAGFDWYNCSYRYNGALKLSRNIPGRTYGGDYHCIAPTLDVAQRWLREVKGYSIYPTYGGYKIYVLDTNDSAGFSRTYGLNSNLTYEEAQEAGIKKALEIILEKGE